MKRRSHKRGPRIVLWSGACIAFLCAVILVLSGFYGFTFCPTRYETVGFVSGEFSAHWRGAWNPPPQSASDGRLFTWDPLDSNMWLSEFTFYKNTANQEYVLFFPVWVGIGGGLLLCAAGYVKSFAADGECIRCGYDCAGLSPEGICPECGGVDVGNRG